MGCCPAKTNNQDGGDNKQEEEEETNEFSGLPHVRVLKDNESIDDFFEMERELGRGGSCRVLKVIKKETGAKYAMKELVRNDTWNPILFRQEIRILTTIQHPNVLSYAEAYVAKEHFYICTLLCTGGELFEQVKRLKHFSEKSAAEVLKIILTAVAHIHSKQIVHRDLKPENIVYEKPYGNLVLIDFGDAVELQSDGQIFSDFVGTPFYLAPECVRHRSGWELYKSDIWAVGVIAYVLLTGRPPFWGRNNREILMKITTKGVTWPKNVKLSRACKHFILSLLQKEPRKRLSALEALEHPWLVKEASQQDKHLGDDLLKNISNFHSACKLKKLIVYRLVEELTREEKTVIAAAFRELDENGDGVLDRAELGRFLTRAGLLPEEVRARTEELMRALDRDGDGVINLNEFMAGGASLRLSTDQDFIERQFRAMDLDGDGQISVEEMQKAFNSELPEEEIRKIVAEVDTNKDGQVNLEEFRTAMRDHIYNPNSKYQTQSDDTDNQTQDEDDEKKSKNTLSLDEFQD